jgi:hypothetical protein
MRTNTPAWLVIALFVALIGWWWLDPVGFSQNPVITWFKICERRVSSLRHFLNAAILKLTTFRFAAGRTEHN